MASVHRKRKKTSPTFFYPPFPEVIPPKRSLFSSTRLFTSQRGYLHLLCHWPYIGNSRKRGGIKKFTLTPGEMIAAKAGGIVVGTTLNISSRGNELALWQETSPGRFDFDGRRIRVNKQDIVAVNFRLTQANRLPSDIKSAL